MASGFEILGLIGSIVIIVDTTIEVYDAIKNLHGLPEAFQQVSNRLPLVKNAFEDAKGPAKNASSNDEKALKELLESCEKKARELQKIFMKIAKKSTGSEPVISVYRSLVLKLGKKSRVEILMDDILKDLQVMVAHSVFRAATQKRVEEVERARQELAEVPPSLSDSDFDERPDTANQYGDGNRQYNAFGGIQKDVDGSYFEAGRDQNFGTMPLEASKKE
ncbi:hypothetical protein COCVIDRAFT_92155 [Bipolaris victoriae FI3]|uniref:NACHT-NTPase and P-loop NTPases N-terminal domain-containing protein n=1 Tax=Bipolaris victoriae (strain FI3) TaxID=930091 RepID=W7EP55_BIPV3|nr:hypothetical protein COCVIDRAFT_92155 [Bipolaris victoriae FI3]